MDNDAIRIEADTTINIGTMNASLDSIWSNISSDPEFQKNYGTDLENPFSAKRGEAQFDVATTIVIPIAAAVTKDVALAIWKDYVWPALKRRLGRNLTESQNVAAS